MPELIAYLFLGCIGFIFAIVIIAVGRLIRKYWLAEKGEEMKRPKIVCLCGSTRFKAEFEYWNEKLTHEGVIVLTVGSFPHSNGTMGRLEVSGVKRVLDELHLRKIDLADEVMILNVNGYIGHSTRNELNYARKQGKEIRFLEKE